MPNFQYSVLSRKRKHATSSTPDDFSGPALPPNQQHPPQSMQQIFPVTTTPPAPSARNERQPQLPPPLPISIVPSPNKRHCITGPNLDHGTICREARSPHLSPQHGGPIALGSHDMPTSHIHTSPMSPALLTLLDMTASADPGPGLSGRPRLPRACKREDNASLPCTRVYIPTPRVSMSGIHLGLSTSDLPDAGLGVFIQRDYRAPDWLLMRGGASFRWNWRNRDTIQRTSGRATPTHYRRSPPTSTTRLGGYDQRWSDPPCECTVKTT